MQPRGACRSMSLLLSFPLLWSQASPPAPPGVPAWLLRTIEWLFVYGEPASDDPGRRRGPDLLAQGDEPVLPARLGGLVGHGRAQGAVRRAGPLARPGRDPGRGRRGRGGGAPRPGVVPSCRVGHPGRPGPVDVAAGDRRRRADLPLGRVDALAHDPAARSGVRRRGPGRDAPGAGAGAGRWGSLCNARGSCG